MTFPEELRKEVKKQSKQLFAIFKNTKKNENMLRMRRLVSFLKFSLQE